ncbi:MAG: heme exporter protein CcmB [Betaproteobacteria bacterium]|nr:MAG: heme exporter protein CcmB [Betaproteobacteria bacterium]
MSEPSVGAAIAGVVRRDLLLAARRKSEPLFTLGFFVLVASLFPLSIGPEPDLLKRIAPGVLWVAALLAAMLSLGRMFAADYDDGTLEQLALAPVPLVAAAAGKVLAHWLVSGFPLVVVSPVLALQYGLPADVIAMLMLSLLIGTPVLSLVGAIGAALTLGVRGGGVLVALLVLPLYVPALIFGAGAVDARLAGLSPAANLSLLGACLALAAVFAPLATAAGIRIALE